MILKLLHVNQWHIWDNICKARYGTLKLSSADLKNYFEEVSPDGLFVLDFKDEAEIKTFVEFCYRDMQHNEKIMLFEGVAYLCNDEGKTIEKIVSY